MTDIWSQNPLVGYVEDLVGQITLHLVGLSWWKKAGAKKIDILHFEHNPSCHPFVLIMTQQITLLRAPLSILNPESGLTGCPLIGCCSETLKYRE